MDPTILLVDDEPGLRSLLTEFLTDEGYAVTEAGTCREAWVALEQHDFDLLVSDIRMPDASGLELAELILTAKPKTRMIFISGYFESLPPRIAERGVAILRKPLELDDLKVAVEAALRGAAPRTKRYVDRDEDAV